MSRSRLAIIATHPIQYQKPWFTALAAHPDLDLQVFFCHNATAKEQSSAGFGVEFEWDRPLLEGYPYQFLKNVSKHPSVGVYAGLDTPEIENIITQEQFDAVLVLGWNYKSFWQAMRACWKTRTPVMTRGDSHLHTPRHPLKSALKYPFYRWFIPKFDACLAVGKWSADYYKHYGAKANRIYLVPHALDETFFANEATRLAPQKTQIRRQWGLRDDATVFMFAGKFIDKKRPIDFVKAVELARQQNSQIAGLMVGDGTLRSECEEFVRQHQTPIKFAGFLNQSQITQAFIAADALVLPSDGGETWGVVVNEAMFCGLPCIVSDYVGCGPDLIVAGETGSTFPLGDVGALSRALISLAFDRATLKKMSEHARQRVIDKYSMKVAVEGVLEAVGAVKHKAQNE
jgi:glycosyltransferase involved in cell wall biosynthesis